jgi:hypothetical protein
MDQDRDIDISRRRLGAFLGALGGAAGFSALSGCVGDAVASAEAQTSEALTGTSFKWADTIGTAAVPGDLRRAVGTASIHTIVAGGFWAIGDGGGGVFHWDATSTAADDGGTVVRPAGVSGAGRWRRVYGGALNVKWFGARGDGATDDYAAIADPTQPSALRAATAAGGGTVYLPVGNYRLGTTLTLNQGINLVGEGPYASVLTFTGGGVGIAWQPTSGIGDIIDAEIKDLQVTTSSSAATVGVQINDAGHAVLRKVAVHGSWSVAGVTLQGFSGKVSPAQNCAFCHLDECFISGCYGDGVRLLGQVFSCAAWRCIVTANGKWGINAGLPPLGGATSKSQFSAYHCDFEGNAAGGITGSFEASEFVGNYYEPYDCSGACTAAPFVSIPAGQQCYGLGIRENYVAGFWGDYGVDIFTGSGVAGLALENNFFGIMGTAVAAVRIGGVIHGRMKGNLFGNPIGVEVWGTDASNDLGLRLCTYRFAGSFGAPGPLAPVAGSAPGFGGVPLPADGYVVGATVMLSQAPGSAVAEVQIQAGGATVIDFKEPQGYPAVGVAITGPGTAFDACAKQGVVPQASQLGANKLAAGALLTANVAATGGLGPGVGVIVDVVVGFGDIGV